MFQKVFQGGPHVEVFVASGRDSGAHGKFHGPASSINKEFSKPVKSYVYHFEGDSTVTKLQLPKMDKQTLALVQPYCVFQLNIPSGANVAIDLCVSDVSSNRRRILLSTSQRDVASSPLHAKVPLSDLPRDQWINMCVNMHSLVAGLFKTQGLKSLDSIVIGGTFQLRRIFTVKAQPPGSRVPSGDFPVDHIPKCCTLNGAETVVISHLSITALNSTSARSQVSTASRQPSAGERVESGKVTHIAFGSRVEIPNHVLKNRPVENDELSIQSSLPGSRGSLSTATGMSSREGESRGNPLVGQPINPHPPKVPPSRSIPVRLPKQRIKSVSFNKSKQSDTSETEESRPSDVLQSSVPSSTSVPHVSSGSTELQAVQKSGSYPDYNADEYRDETEGTNRPLDALQPPDPLHSQNVVDNDIPSPSILHDLSSYQNSAQELNSHIPNHTSPQSQSVIFQYCSPPKQFSHGLVTPDTSLDRSNVSQDSLNPSHEGRARTREDNFEEDFVSVGSDIHPLHQPDRTAGVTLLQRKPGSSNERRDASCGVDEGTREGAVRQDVSLMRLSKIYDWRQYQSVDNPGGDGPLSIESRLAAVQEGRHLKSPLSPDLHPPPGETSTSDSAEHDNSLANTMTLTMTWDDKLRDFATPMLDTLELR
jgi:hypothetical protein